jgi:hypothetical protein
MTAAAVGQGLPAVASSLHLLHRMRRACAGKQAFGLFGLNVCSQGSCAS